MSLETLLSYFPSGTAEGEKGLLEQVFVYANELAKVIAPPEGNPYLLVGDKGSGKTALVDFASRLAEKQGIPSVVLTPFDIDTSTVSAASSTGDMQREFYRVLLAAISAKISESNTGWTDGNYATLYREAVQAGNRSPDFVGKMGRFLAEVAKPVVGVDMGAAFPLLTIHTRSEVEKSMAAIVGRTSFYLFLDDTDQIGSPEEPGHLNRVWALLLAVRRLATNVPALKAIISLRTEVWNRLQFDQNGQRDQTDHFKTLIVRMESTRDHVEKILERRLALASIDVGQPNTLYKPFFENDGAAAPFSHEFRSWKDLISVRSRQRPRDAIQLVNALARYATGQGKAVIDQACFHAVMPIFSRDVSERFAQEVSSECPQALEVLKSFAVADYDNPGFTMSSDATLAHLRKLFSKFGIQVYGRPLGTNLENDSFELWRFLYTSGVLNARVSDATQKDGYRHLPPGADLSLVSKVRWNDLQKLLWEINAAYRDYLIQLQKEEEVRIGLPVKRTRPRRRR
ncbi:P-loop ATPase, Sll1717 family [Devosia sp.]|uniref:P-loop ATPase, Sll1717 family n=1 Tax=Devosia sp. TaxID=1871048 RepID=UPI003F730A20